MFLIETSRDIHFKDDALSKKDLIKKKKIFKILFENGL